jgi:hypothetical protein
MSQLQQLLNSITIKIGVVSDRDPDIETNLHNWLFLDNAPLKTPVQFYIWKSKLLKNDVKKSLNALILMMSIALMRRHMLLCIYIYKKKDIGRRQLHLNWLFQIHHKNKKKNVKKIKTQKETTMKCNYVILSMWSKESYVCAAYVDVLISTSTDVFVHPSLAWITNSCSGTLPPIQQTI